MEDLVSIAGMDIYLIDQIMKGRYRSGDKILDAGAGSGRNLRWFATRGFELSACDQRAECEGRLRANYPDATCVWNTCSLSDLPYENAAFEHIICNAVLHFAENEAKMKKMFSELTRVLKPRGSLFIRSCMDIGMEKDIKPIGKGRAILPDGSERFLLTRDLLGQLLQSNGLQLAEPLKVAHVIDKRAMGTIVLTCL